MRSTTTGATPFDAASPPVRLTYLEEPPGEGWARSGAVLAQRYELEARDNAGAPGNFWRARQLRSRRAVTVQLLEPAIMEDAVLMEAFLHEASLAAAIDHPHVARVLDYGIDYELADGVPFLVLDHLTGETLERQLAQRPRLSPAEVARLLVHAAQGLEALHARGVVHRRLDPAHLLVCDDYASGTYRTGTVSDRGHSLDHLELVGGANTVLLFALDEVLRESLCLVHKLSRQLAGGRAGAAAVLPAVGSGAAPEPLRVAQGELDAGEYQSPEQLLGQGTVDARSDLWSLAVVAFQALTGTPAFGGGTLGERLVRVCSGEPSPVPADCAVPAGFADWFQRGVRKRPSERFGSAHEMSAAFLRLLRG